MRKFKVFCVLALALFLAACAGDEEVIRIFNWGNYMDESLFEEFREQTGIRVIVSHFASNEEMYTRVSTGASEFDLLFPSDYMIERMIREDLLLPLDFSNIPNFSYIDDRFLNLPFDAENRYSVPYMWGTLGILYNTTMVNSEVNSWDILWNPDYEGQIFMYDSKRDSFAIALIRLGYSLNSTNEAEVLAARDLLIEQRSLVRAFVGDDVKHSMVGREAALAVVYSGDAMFTMQLNPELNFAVPIEGTNVWYDSMVIPRGARNQAGAEAFINFLNYPEIALRNTLYIGYSTVNSGAFALLPEEIRTNPVYWPSDEVYYRGTPFIHLGDFTAFYERAWTEVLATRP